MKIKVIYHDEHIPKLQQTDKGDWIDVRVSKAYKIIDGKFEELESIDTWEGKLYKYNKGDVIVVNLGFSLDAPSGYEKYLLPRSSTFKNTGLILVNSMGIIDETYRGIDDVWMMQFYATRNGQFYQYDRIGQFRLIEKMPKVEFEELTQEDWIHTNRGGIGSTGTK